MTDPFTQVVIGLIIGVPIVLGGSIWIYRRASRSTSSARWIPLSLFYALAAMGAVLLVAHYILEWGLAAALWFLIVPFLYGLYRGWPSTPSSRPGPH